MRIFLSFFAIILFSICKFELTHAQQALSMSDRLFVSGKHYYDAGQYKKAIEYFSKCVEIDKSEDIPFSIRNEYSSMWLAHCHYLIGEKEKAKSIFVFCDADPIDKSKTIKSDSLYDMARIHFKNKNYDKAKDCLILSSSIEVQTIGDGHIWHSGTLDFLAECYSSLHLNDSCLLTLEKSIAIKKSYYGESLSYVDELINIANMYSRSGNFDEAIKHEMEAANIIDRFPEEKEQYWKCMISIADFYAAKHEYAESIRIIKETIYDCSSIMGTSNYLYVTAMNELASFHLKCGEFEKAINCCEKALEACQSMSPEKGEDYAMTLNNLGTIYAVMGNYRTAIEVTEEAKDIRFNIFGNDSPDYALCLNNIAKYYSKLGNYAYAIKMEELALDSYFKYYGYKGSEYATSENNLAEYYYLKGDIEAAIETEKDAVEIWLELFGENHPDYAISLNDLANFYYINGNYEEAISCCEKALSIRKKIWGERHPDYILSLNNLAQYKYGTGLMEEGIKIQKNVVSLYEQILGTSHPDYALSLLNLAEMYSKSDSLQKAIELAEEVSRIFSSTYGENGAQYAFSLSLLTEYYALEGRKKETEELAVQTGLLYNDIILTNFYHLTSTERPLFWRANDRWYIHELPYISYLSRTPGILSVLYNSVLFSKGILLNAEIEMRKLIQESGNQEVLNVFDKNKRDRDILNYLLNQPKDRRKLNSDSLENIIRNQEAFLMKKSQSFGNYTNSLSTTWKQVQSRLDKKEAAVEFLLVSLSPNETRICALVLKSDSQYPVFFDLCDEEQVKMISQNKDFENDRLYSLVWEPLKQTLKGIKSIYFAPAGCLYNLPLEYAKLSGKTYMNDRFNMFRVSSTRELVEVSTDSIRNAVLYGGLAYYADSTSIRAANDENKIVKTKQYVAERAVLDSTLSRDGLKYLEGTKREIDTIDIILAANDVPHKKYEGVFGTEESVKALSGSGTGILHIATHGFYWTPDEINRYIPFVHSDDISDLFSIEDKALTRSGLCMSGAGGALSGSPFPEYMEDGVLTGQEISVLDFRRLDLVVLSACKTGLGDVTSDGVYGLQRAFKKSGAHTIIMSLWKVDDDATSTMMADFYKNLLSGLDLQESFKKSISHMRRLYRYKEWASFVILDGI